MISCEDVEALMVLLQIDCIYFYQHHHYHYSELNLWDATGGTMVNG